MDKSDSMRIEARSKRAQKLIAKTLKAADQPGKKDIPVWNFLMQMLRPVSTGGLGSFDLGRMIELYIYIYRYIYIS